MLQYSCECDPNILSLFQPKVLKAIDYIRNINKQCPDVDAIYKHISRSETCNIDKPTAAKIIDAVIDQNVIENRRITSGQASYFHCREGTTKTVTASPEKLAMKVIYLSQPTTLATPSDVSEALNQ